MTAPGKKGGKVRKVSTPSKANEADRFRAVLDAVKALDPGPMRTALWAAILGEGLCVRNYIAG
jgi:hypothetical protein